MNDILKPIPVLSLKELLYFTKNCNCLNHIVINSKNKRKKACIYSCNIIETLFLGHFQHILNIYHFPFSMLTMIIIDHFSVQNRLNVYNVDIDLTF